MFFLKQSLGDHIQRALTGFAAGVMVAASVWSLLIIHFVQLEALNWCKTAIPIGCALGTVTCWVLCLILRFVVKGEWVDMPLFAVSASGILSGAVAGVVTVFIAAHSPARYGRACGSFPGLSAQSVCRSGTGRNVKCRNTNILASYLYV